MNSGVTPTPGQILGGVSNRLEEAGQSIPFVGDAIKAARSRAVEDLNRAAINRALNPIGESLDRNTPLGREAITEMHDKIAANYDRLVPHLQVQAGSPIRAERAWPDHADALAHVRSGATAARPYFAQ